MPRRPSRWLAVAFGLCALGIPAALAAPVAGATTAPATGGATTTTAPPSQGASAQPITPTPTTIPPSHTAYWMDASNGKVYAFGGAPQYGTMAGQHLNKPIVGMASMPTGQGYWLVASDGGIFTFGNASFFGSTGGIHLNKPIVGMASTPDGHGYWLVASDGGIFTFGDARFYGSMGGHWLNKPIVGMTPTSTGGGYWLVASDGGIFTFGNASFFGSTGSMQLASLIVGMSTMPTGQGYWLVAGDGGIFTFGKAGGSHFYGSLGGIPDRYPIVGMSSLYDGNGYWLANANGGVTSFGTAHYWGSAPESVTAPVVGIATGQGTGVATSASFQSGSFGYDVSNYQCTGFPPNPHSIGVVEVDGWGTTYPNPCLAQEATWAGGGLELYIFLISGTSSTPEPGCSTAPSPTACNYGYAEASTDYATARSVLGARATVPWWLDVERSVVGGQTSWTSTATANRSTVEGAVDALRNAAGINTVGVYTSPHEWTTINGTFRPSIPLWAADWAKAAPATVCLEVRTAHPDLPSGPLDLVQYSSPTYSYAAGDLTTRFDNDYAC